MFGIFRNKQKKINKIIEIVNSFYQSLAAMVLKSMKNDAKTAMVLYLFMIGVIDCICQASKFNDKDFIKVLEKFFEDINVQRDYYLILINYFLEKSASEQLAARCIQEGGRLFNLCLKGNDQAILESVKTVSDFASNVNFPNNIGILYTELKQN